MRIAAVLAPQLCAPSRGGVGAGLWANRADDAFIDPHCGAGLGCVHDAPVAQVQAYVVDAGGLAVTAGQEHVARFAPGGAPTTVRRVPGRHVRRAAPQELLDDRR